MLPRRTQPFCAPFGVLTKENGKGVQPERGASNGRQPLRSGCIRGPLAAASRGSRWSFGSVRQVWDFSVLFVSPWLLFSPLRHGGHREFCGSVAARRGFVFVYLACFAGYISSAEPEMFEDMNTSQNKPLEPTGLRLSVFAFIISPVAHLFLGRIGAL